MENQEPKRGNGLISPEKVIPQTKKQPKKIPNSQDGLMERDENKVLTQDGRELLKEN